MYVIKLISHSQKDLDQIPPKIFTRLKDAIAALSQNPRPHCSQKLTSHEGYRIRIGDYRILYRIDDKAKEIYIYRVKHRRDAYR